MDLLGTARPDGRGRDAHLGRSPAFGRGRLRDLGAVIPAQAGIQVFRERRVLTDAGVSPAWTSRGPAARCGRDARGLNHPLHADRRKSLKVRRSLSILLTNQ